MIRWNAIIVGCILVIVLKYIGTTTGTIGSDFGVLIAGGIIGYLVDGDIMNGTIHGIIIGTVGAVILSFIYIINVNIYGLKTPVLLTTLNPIVSSAIFGAAGAVLFLCFEKIVKVFK